MANFAMNTMVNGSKLLISVDLPVAELLHQSLLSTNTSFMSDEEFMLFTQFKNKLLDMVREMK